MALAKKYGLRRGIRYDRNSMRISVALCTYNGAKFLEEQLGSIARQTVLPWELVVCDDASSDETLAILKTFSLRAPFPVRLTENSRCIGYVRNFEQAMIRCRGDVVVTCDQDDVWLPNRLARILPGFADPRVGMVVCDAKIVSEGLSDSGQTLWRRTGFRRIFHKWSVKSSDQTRCLLEANPVFGVTMAIRRGDVDQAVPIPTCWPHDNWLSLIAAVTSGITLVDEPLVLYRQHSQQQAPFRLTSNTVKPLPTFEWCQVVADEYEMLVSRLKTIPSTNQDALSLVVAKTTHLRRRARQKEKGRLMRVLAGLIELVNGGYGRYSNGWRSFARDVVSSA